ncbi:hypothetical protein F9L16_01550 [Agarivorans sp. B2Z047]|uniref:hypothetical protein n=1 Tax=Agarivorans sp. B2Z047 TaxID=2652721 RepID=UPI00128E1727|nr:hypothetical protein [Agarivorans sp. B2Z047]MPW27687.1 hypothetical protein [Agarivorans sp. B2Z047]UQN44474.1 hypothetical protein LQZ07_08410 [Agarivorans sp. B2Z047]
MKTKHLLSSLVLSVSLLSAGSVMAAASSLQKINYGEAQEMNLTKVAQKTFLSNLDLDIAEKEAVEWASTQNASHYSVYTVERSPKRDRYRVSIVVYSN